MTRIDACDQARGGVLHGLRDPDGVVDGRLRRTELSQLRLGAGQLAARRDRWVRWVNSSSQALPLEIAREQLHGRREQADGAAVIACGDTDHSEVQIAGD